MSEVQTNTQEDSQAYAAYVPSEQKTTPSPAEEPKKVEWVKREVVEDTRKESITVAELEAKLREGLSIAEVLEEYKPAYRADVMPNGGIERDEKGKVILFKDAEHNTPDLRNEYLLAVALDEKAEAAKKYVSGKIASVLKPKDGTNLIKVA